MSKKSIFLSLALVSFLSSATLEVYQDQAVYKLESNSRFIGFFKGKSISCSDEDVELSYATKCLEDNHLCKLYNEIDSTAFKLDEVSENIKVIDTLINKRKEDSIDANKIIESAMIVAKEKSKLNKRTLTLKKELGLLNSEFEKITTSNEPLYLKEPCDGELKILIPNRYISFSPIYEANIVDNKNIEVTQKVAISNRSGIDIDVKEAKLYYKPLYEYLQPIDFSPWIVSEAKPMPRVLYKTKRVIEKERVLSNGFGIGAEIAPNVEPVEPAVAEVPVGKYSEAREYIVKNLKLPSSQKAKKVKVLEYQSDINCMIEAYPYSSLRAFNICRFKPKYQIDSNRWVIKRDGELINKNGIGRYKDGNYELYVDVDRDIVIKRERVVSKERKSGIFGSTKKQKDGYKITITNKSKEKKELKIVDRIPTSNTDKIEVKLLSIKPSVDYKLLKDGKIEINLNLKPKESKEIEVMFELSYDKELKVNY